MKVEGICRPASHAPAGGALLRYRNVPVLAMTWFVGRQRPTPAYKPCDLSNYVVSKTIFPLQDKRLLIRAWFQQRTCILTREHSNVYPEGNREGLYYKDLYDQGTRSLHRTC